MCSEQSGGASSRVLCIIPKEQGGQGLCTVFADSRLFIEVHTFQVALITHAHTHITYTHTLSVL